jgi:hypothetical protein
VTGPRPRTCRHTHVLLPAVVAPRRADTTAVIGAALQASARAIDYRRIAASIGRPLSTVRRWIRAGRHPQHVQWLRAQAVAWLARVDRDVLAGLTPQPTRLGEALTALAAAALTLRARIAPHIPPWTLIGQITHGRSSPGHHRPGRTEIPPPPGPRTSATRRHRDDTEPVGNPPGRATETTTPPPRRRNRPVWAFSVVMANGALVVIFIGGQQ